MDGFRFDLKVDARGYAWWYLDAMSADMRHAIVIIAFVGSVFSPYYKLSGRHRPFDHCAMNVVLYSGFDSRWAMTERGEGSVDFGARACRIGPSRAAWNGRELIFSIDERACPAPVPVRGEVRATLPHVLTTEYQIDHRGGHWWRPIAPSCQVDVDLKSPNLKWSGHGYLDANRGDEPLEDGFEYWDWRRSPTPDGGAAIAYNVTTADGRKRDLALRIEADGIATHQEIEPVVNVHPTLLWRMPRRTTAAARPRVLATLEDTPFYSRSILELPVDGAPTRAVHETLSAPRLRAGWVTHLLPYRMPRRP